MKHQEAMQIAGAFQDERPPVKQAADPKSNAEAVPEFDGEAPGNGNATNEPDPLQQNVFLNDPVYSQESLQDALRRDLRALEAEFPQDYPPSINESAESWESALELSEFQAQISLIDGLESANDAESVVQGAADVGGN
jgi:hypothetical protein